MDLLDLIIVGIIALGGWNGYRTGLFRQLTRLFGAVIAYFLSVWLKPYVAPVVASFVQNHKHNPNGGPLFSNNSLLSYVIGDLSGAIAFGLVFIISFLLLRYAAGLIDALFHLPVLSTINRLTGLIVGLILAAIFVYVGSLILQYVNNQRIQHELQNSMLVQWLNDKPWPATMK